MKNILFTVFALLLFSGAKGQSFEWSFQTNSGLYHYTGSNSASSTYLLNVDPAKKQGYANNPYGRENAFSYGAGFQCQWVSKGGFFVGLQASFDVLRSKASVDTVYNDYLYANGVYYFNVNDFFTATGIPARGETYSVTEDINAYPFIGYRIKGTKIKLDLSAGVDLAFNVNNYEYGNAKDINGNNYTTGYYLSNLPADIRLRLGAAAWYRKFALTASFADGVTNLFSTKNGYIPGKTTTRDQLIRFGLAYKIK